MTAIEADGSKISARLVEWWGKGVFAFLCFSILLLAVGRFEFPLSGARFSAWSVSRTTFIFWLIWKILIWFRLGRRNLGLNKNSFPLALLAFFAVVTASLLPDFHEADDYRYLFFAVMHCVMVLDLFAEGERPKLLLLFLGLLPGVLVIRGILYNPSVLNFSLVNRFGYPLAHANSAGLLFAMSIPLALAVIASQKGWVRGVTLGVARGAVYRVNIHLLQRRMARLSHIATWHKLDRKQAKERRVCARTFGIGCVCCGRSLAQPSDDAGKSDP